MEDFKRTELCEKERNEEKNVIVSKGGISLRVAFRCVISKVSIRKYLQWRFYKYNPFDSHFSFYCSYNLLKMITRYNL